MITSKSKLQARNHNLTSCISKLVAPIKHSHVFLNAIATAVMLVALTGITLAQKQTHDYCYIIKKGSDSIGKLRTRQTIDGIKTINTLDSKVEFNLLIDFKINETCTDVFYNNNLFNGLTIRTINGHEKVHNTILKTNDGYHLKKKRGSRHKLFWFHFPFDFELVF